MALNLSVPFQLINPNYSNFPFPLEILKKNTWHLKTVNPNCEKKKNEFFELLESISLNPLITLLQGRVHIPSEQLKEALWKKRGYFTRLFSHESWEEWTENRTSIGKVVSLYSDYIKCETSLKTIFKGLDSRTLQEANHEAAQLLKISNAGEVHRFSCITDLFMGALGSSKTRSPFSLAASTLSCLESVYAQRGRNPNVAASNRYDNKRSQILADNYQRRKQAGVKEPPPPSLIKTSSHQKIDLVLCKQNFKLYF